MSHPEPWHIKPRMWLWSFGLSITIWLLAFWLIYNISYLWYGWPS